MNGLKKLMPCHVHDALVIEEPLLIDSVEKIFVLPEIEFDAEHDIEILAFGGLQCALVTGAVDLDSLLPRKVFGNAGVAVEEMIRYDHSGITLRHHVRNVIFTVHFAACTCLTCMKMRLV